MIRTALGLFVSWFLVATPKMQGIGRDIFIEKAFAVRFFCFAQPTRELAAFRYHLGVLAERR